MSPLTVRARRFFAFGVPLFLLAVLVGCARNEAPVEQVAATTTEKTDGPGNPNLTNEDPGLNSHIEAAHPEKDRLEKMTVNPILPAPDSTVFAPPGLTSPLPSDPNPGDPAHPAGQPALGAFNGRSGTTKMKTVVVKEGGGQENPTKQSGYNAQNAESYGVYSENEFRSPLVAPLSTFSADVNTASYSNVRRMLNDGRLPPASAVFLAEFVNYFPYSYAQPKGEDPVAFHVEMGPCPWNRKHHLVRVGMQAYQIPADKMPPRNLVFLIDTSGSMQQENRLPLVQKALGLLVDQLGEKDRVSIVTYAGDSRVALMPTKGTDKKTIKSMIDSLSAGGGTNGEGGIRKAYELARATFIDGGVNRVILCTDGDFNVGVTDNGELIKLIEEQRRSKVFLTILGFGMGNYKDDRLKELANHGNGHHAYIDTLDEAKKIFVEQGGSLVCVAKDVKFQVDFNPAKVTAYRLVGYENRLLKDEDFKNDKKDAGDLGSGHQVTVLYEIVPTGVEIDLPGVDPSKYQKKDVPKDVSDEWLTVRMRYKHPEADTSKELSQPLKGEVGKDLSDDFRFAASVASFGMILRNSKFRGAMTYAGVLEEARGCVGADTSGHRKQFLELVAAAKKLNDGSNGPDAGTMLAGGIDADTIRKLVMAWSSDIAEARAKKFEEILATIPAKHHAAVKDYFQKLEKAQKEK
jgi:Ca-activated chloride channel family protein